MGVKQFAVCVVSVSSHACPPGALLHLTKHSANQRQGVDTVSPDHKSTLRSVNLCFIVFVGVIKTESLKHVQLSPYK